MPTQEPKKTQSSDFSKFQQELESENIETRFSENELELYKKNTLGINRNIRGISFPKDQDQVIHLLRLANLHSVKLYPVSTGNNWGYGAQLPITNDCLIVNLSKLNKIHELNNELSYVTLGPGVDQKMLSQYFIENNFNFMVPTTGAGPNCSILGNALERGYGITPIADHFESLLSIKAVLPNGEIYEGALAGFSGKTINNCFKWGIGPYLDGLFSQGSFGIVTEVTIALKKKPQKTEAFFFSLENDEDLLKVIPVIKKLRENLGSIIGGINLMNARRVLSMMETGKSDGKLFTKDEIDEFSSKHHIGHWNGVGALYGPEKLVKIAKKMITKELKKCSNKIFFFDKKKIVRINSLLSFLKIFPELSTKAKKLNLLIDALEGTPSTIALPLAYWKTPELLPKNLDDINPAEDGAGLIWYSPLIPKSQNTVIQFIRMVEDNCLKKNIEPLITLTSLSTRCFDATIPILFNKKNEKEKADAHDLYKILLKEGQELGVAPYRLGVDFMESLTQSRCSSLNLGQTIKSAIDPNGIISPGRYVRETS